MGIVLGLAALASFLAGLMVAGNIRSDIQIQIVATCWTGAFILAGMAAIASRLKRVETLLKQPKDQAPNA